MEIEIPFVPASQRLVKEEKDTIVVVGQARQKRKRPKANVGADGVEASGSAGGKVKKTKVNDETEGKDEDREAFDFSAIPNILDNNPNVGDGNKKKKRERKEKKGGRFSFFFFNHDTHFIPSYLSP